MAQEPDGFDESDSAQSPGDTEHSHDESDASGGLLDVEARDESEDDYDESAENEFWNGREDEDEDEDEDGSGDENTDKRTLPLFGRLPPELRYYIWKLAARKLKQPRILRFRLAFTETVSEMTGGNFRIFPEDEVSAQTLEARRLLAVNRESRYAALEILANTLEAHPSEKADSPIVPNALIHFNADRDVVLVNGLGELGFEKGYRLSDFSRNIKQLALGSDDLGPFGSFQRFPYFLSQFPAVKRLFVTTPFYVFDDVPELYSWCGSKFGHVFEFRSYEWGTARRYRIPSIMCWPNLDDYREYAQNQITSMSILSVQMDLPEELRNGRIEHWPMILFEDHMGVQEFNSLSRKWKRSKKGAVDNEDNWSVSSSGSEPFPGFQDGSADEDEDEDEYEYDDDFIDDSEFPEGIDAEHSDLDDLDDVANLSNTDTLRDGGLFDDDDENDDEGQFSDLEPDMDDARDNNDQSTETRKISPTARVSRKRQIVTDSDDEVEARENGRGKRARIRSTLLSDNDDDDDDDDDGESRGEVLLRGENAAAATNTSARQPKLEESESDVEYDEEEEGEEAVPKRQSLAEKLQAVRSTVLVSSDDERDESADEGLDYSADDNDEDDASDGDLMNGAAEDVEDLDEEDDDDDENDDY